MHYSADEDRKGKGRGKRKGKKVSKRAVSPLAAVSAVVTSKAKQYDYPLPDIWSQLKSTLSQHKQIKLIRVSYCQYRDGFSSH